MSEHNVAVVEKKKISDGSISVRLRCCGDDLTDSWHTLQLTHEAHNPDEDGGVHACTPEEVQAWLDGRKAWVVKLHAANQQADALIENLIIG